MNGWEIWLAIYASGWGLDRFATVLGEHIKECYAGLLC